jgi:hypothetical protein
MALNRSRRKLENQQEEPRVGVIPVDREDSQGRRMPNGIRAYVGGSELDDRPGTVAEDTW